MIDYNSTVNQEIKRKLVDHEVLTCITDWADTLFKDFEDWDNVYGPTCPECGNINTVIEDDRWYDEEKPYSCSNCGKRFDDMPDAEYAEVLEYWITTPYLGRKLREHGEAVMERDNGWVWGRGTTGQAIQLDGVISEICNELHMLKKD